MAGAEAAPTTVARTLPMTRREFLYFIWGASMALFMAEFGGALVWFAMPRFRAGEFGGLFTLALDEIPPVDSDPKEYADGRFWLVNAGEQTVGDPRQPQEYRPEPGVKALYKVCVHLGCLYKWVPTNNRFECPCHGSKYLKTGARIEGPATRNLDVLLVQIVDAAGQVLAETAAKFGDLEGTAIEIPPGAASLRIDTGRRILGAPNTRPGGGA